MPDTPITAANTISEWLAHPAGGQALRDLLAASGYGESVLAPVTRMSLQQVAAIGGGAVHPAAIEDLVRRANGGDLPDAPPGAPAEPVPAEWTERIVPGRFDGRTVVVTGAGSGIGRATASRILREGGRVVAVDIAGERLDDLAGEFPGESLVPVVADLAAPDDVDGILAAAGARIDGLANVAGVTDDMTPLHEVSDAMWQRVMAINVDGVFRLSRAVLPGMLEAGSGAIVNVASEASFRGSAAGAAYTTSKHAVVGLTKSAAFMYARSGIRVNAVAPGPTATNIGADFASEFGSERLMPMMALIPPIAGPAEMAASITFLLSDDATNITGAILPSDGGWSVQ
ncbi:SDR family NAD(P)-dependent oxidoreductase [Aeromicrobium duanguangcaii]|uniref:SDR family NAD(P)-dependent oxidoreductase n=1 Tax=Aeromicrobium duanguangcaii TaxID=2968086 RepID=UPI002016BAF4|nr:SDR family oxidoreductase [Aeromicrobium duanguangcaii]